MSLSLTPPTQLYRERESCVGEGDGDGDGGWLVDSGSGIIVESRELSFCQIKKKKKVLYLLSIFFPGAFKWCLAVMTNLVGE